MNRRYSYPLPLRLPLLVALLAGAVWVKGYVAAQSLAYTGNVAVGDSASAAPDSIRGLDGKRNAYVRSWDLPCKPACWPPIVREFTVRFPLPNRMDKEWW